MNTVFKAWVYENPEHFGGYTGEIEGVNINTNIEDLKDTSVEFYANTKAELLQSMICFLKSQGKTGILRVVK